MDATLQARFIEQWRQYFADAALPMAFFYTDDGARYGADAFKGSRCAMGDLRRAQAGEVVCLGERTVGCAGGKRFFGFMPQLRPGFEHFLSCGIPGKMPGERYKKSAELVLEFVKHQPALAAPAKYIVFKRWDKLEADEQPLAVIFLAMPDVLAGLFTLANFDEADPNGVIAPFCAGCSSIVLHPRIEAQSPRPRAVLGTFDVSARPQVDPNTLTFAVPWAKFTRMVDNMSESFLTLDAWSQVRRRIAGTNED